jgi:hypothetical protein
MAALGRSSRLLSPYTASSRCAWNGAQQIKNATTTATATNFEQKYFY